MYVIRNQNDSTSKGRGTIIRNQGAHYSSVKSHTLHILQYIKISYNILTIIRFNTIDRYLHNNIISICIQLVQLSFIHRFIQTIR